MENNEIASVILFDVNETLMDMNPLKKKINALLNTRRGFRIWFGMLLHYSLVDNHTGQYHDFSEIANATLGMAAKTLKINIEKEQKKEALGTIKKLSAYPDVKTGLELLKEAGFRLATLTNSPMQTLTAQLQHAGIENYFEETLSIDTIKKYKPAVDTYQFAAQKMGVNTNEVIMVAAHGWDIAGALNAGMQAAFIERKGQSLYPLTSSPQYKGMDLEEVAKIIIKKKKSEFE